MDTKKLFFFGTNYVLPVVTNLFENFELKKQHTGVAPNVAALLEMSNSLVSWVSMTVLEPTTVMHRAKAMEKVIKIMKVRFDFLFIFSFLSGNF